MSDNKLDLIMGAAGIADYLGVKRAQVYRLVYAGELPTFKLGKVVAARKTALSAWLDGKEVSA